MLLKPGTSPEEAQKVADADPAVRNKLFKAKVQKWLLFIDNERQPAGVKKSQE